MKATTNETDTFRVLLMNMPFVSISRPAIGISILKAVLNSDGVACDVAYPNLSYAEWESLETYSLLDEKISDALFTGDWLFGQYLFGAELDLQSYAATLQQYLDDDEKFARVLAARERIGPFLLHCMEKYRVADYDVVGFTSTFEQNLASLAMAHLIKQAHPEKAIVFGGGNCEGSMGLALHRNFPWVDYVCTGEGEHCFVELIDTIRSGGSADGVEGIVYRDGDGSIDNGPPAPIEDLDGVPVPDFDDYFRELDATSFRSGLNPALLIETSRGCWWGAKSHCTFCGLNGGTMSFRSKSAKRAIEEIEYLKERHGVSHFMAVDNIIDMRYFRDVLPELKERQLAVSLFYETKANLKKEQVKLLRDSGVTSIQPGVESLSSHVLRLMRKGVSAIQNVQLLKWCREYGVMPAWNLLYGFPGETEEDYAEIAEYMEALYHLQPPYALGAVRMDRFSPYFNDAASFGMVNVRPFSIYSLIYPLDVEELRSLVYFFEYDYDPERAPDEYVREVVDKVAEWKRAAGCQLTKTYSSDPELVINDTRPNRVHERVGLSGIQREVYDLCDRRRTFRGIIEHLERRYALPDGFDEWLRAFLDTMVEWRLMMREGEEYLSLSLPAAGHEAA